MLRMAIAARRSRREGRPARVDELTEASARLSAGLDRKARTAGATGSGRAPRWGELAVRG
jgi:hypothetical protein